MSDTSTTRPSTRSAAVAALTAATFVYAITAVSSSPFSELFRLRPNTWGWLSYSSITVPCGIAALVIGLRWDAARAAVGALRAAWPVWVLLGTTLLLSVASMAPGFSVTRLELPVVAALVAVAAALVLKPAERLDVLALALGLGVCASVAIARWWPALGRQANGDWQGWYGHKNNLGAVVGLAIPTIVLAVARSWRGTQIVRPLLGVPALCACAVALVKSGSKTALVLVPITGAVFAMAVAGRVVRQRPVRQRWAALGACAVAVAAVVVLLARLDTAEIRAIRGDRSLTGRRQFWDALQPWIERRWLSGYGFETFFTGRNGYLIFVRRAVRYDPTFLVHAHSGYVQTALDLGLLGIVALSILLGVALRRSWRQARGWTRPADLWPIAALTVILVTNVTEPMFHGPPSVYWIVLVLVVLSSWTGSPSGTTSEPPNRDGEDDGRGADSCAALG